MADKLTNKEIDQAIRDAASAMAFSETLSRDGIVTVGLDAAGNIVERPAAAVGQPPESDRAAYQRSQEITDPAWDDAETWDDSERGAVW